MPSSETMARAQVAPAGTAEVVQKSRGETPRAGGVDARLGAQACACGAPAPVEPAVPAPRDPIAARATLPAAPVRASVAPIGRATGAQAAATFHRNGSTWNTVAGRASESQVAREAYAFVQEIARKHPTADALKAAGWKPHNGSTSHYAFPGFGKSTIWQGEGAHFALAVVDGQGRVTGAQIDGHREYNDPTKPPPGWTGVQWHYHDDRSAPWMAHVDITKPIDQAFIEHAH